MLHMIIAQLDNSSGIVMEQKYEKNSANIRPGIFYFHCTNARRVWRSGTSTAPQGPYSKGSADCTPGKYPGIDNRSCVLRLIKYFS